MRIVGRMDFKDCAAAAATLVAVLAGCSGDAPVAATAPRPAALVVPASTKAMPPGALASAGGGTSTRAATCELPGFQAAALARINRARAAGADCHGAGRFGPARPLVWNDRLALAASQHSRDMSQHDLFSHTGSDGRTVPQRATAVGYPWASIGENIEAGHGSVDDAVAGWMESDHHCANIMEPGFTEMALACVRGGPNTTYTSYWTLDLGRRR